MGRVYPKIAVQLLLLLFLTPFIPSLLKSNLIHFTPSVIDSMKNHPPPSLIQNPVWEGQKGIRHPNNSTWVPFYTGAPSEEPPEV